MNSGRYVFKILFWGFLFGGGLMISRSNRLLSLLVFCFCQVAGLGAQADIETKKLQQVENIYEYLAGMH
jgi:hypothetical protein